MLGIGRSYCFFCKGVGASFLLFVMCEAAQFWWWAGVCPFRVAYVVRIQLCQPTLSTATFLLPTVTPILDPVYCSLRSYAPSLLLIPSPAPFSTFLPQPVTLNLLPMGSDDAPNAYETPGAKSSVFGWGTQSEIASTVPDKLQGAEIPLIDLQSCLKLIPSWQYEVVDARSICAGIAHGGKDACSGDSGGPMIMVWDLLPCMYWTLRVMRCDLCFDMLLLLSSCDISMASIALYRMRVTCLLLRCLFGFIRNGLAYSPGCTCCIS